MVTTKRGRERERVKWKGERVGSVGAEKGGSEG